LIYFGLLIHFQEYNLYWFVQFKLYFWKWTNCPKYIEFL
jgi:hypothetical protein